MVPRLGIGEVAARLGRAPAPVVLDVGTSKSFARGHLPGAIWVPRGWLEARIARHATPGDEIIVTAVDPAQALLAAAALRDAGYGRAAALDAALPDWVASGAPFETGPPPGAADDVVEPPYEKGEQAMRDYLDWEIRLTARADAPRRDAGALERD
jgi:rhodanese-related sulfurtransferase